MLFSPQTIISQVRGITNNRIHSLLSRLKFLVPGRFERQSREMSMLYSQSKPIFQSKGPVLFWVPGGMPLMLHVEGAIAAALRLRGLEVHAVICDGAFSACMRREITDACSIEQWKNTCNKCKKQTSTVLKSMSIPYSFIGDFVPESRRVGLREASASVTWEDLDSLRYGDIYLGKNVRSAVIRYLRGHDLRGHEEIIPEYTFTGLVVAEAALRAMESLSCSRVFMSHGIYTEWGPTLQTCLALGIPVTGWMASYVSARFFMRHIEDSRIIELHNMSGDAWEMCKRSALSPVQNNRLDKYLGDRYRNKVCFDLRDLTESRGDTESLRRRYTRFHEKPIWAILTHVNWDAVSDYAPMAYPSFDDWILDTINEIVKISDVKWLVKIHPAEAWENPRSGVQQLIQKHFPSLPDHVQLVKADEKIGPLDFFQMIDGGVTVYGTPGLELALLGKPVILAGEAHYGGKGFTHDGLSPDEYRGLLRSVGSLRQLNEEQKLLARKYAYCYFLQKQIPLPVVADPESDWWRFQFEKRHLLLPGRDPFVDFICERILDGKDFIMDENLMTIAEKLT